MHPGLRIGSAQAAALYTQAGDYQKTARFYYKKAEDTYYQANNWASYDDWRRARDQWDYFYSRKPSTQPESVRRCHLMNTDTEALPHAHTACALLVARASVAFLLLSGNTAMLPATSGTVSTLALAHHDCPAREALESGLHLQKQKLLLKPSCVWGERLCV